MYASDAIRELQKLVDDHGDLELTVVVGKYEYSLREPLYTEAGPCRNIADIQKQDPPERISFEAKDDIPDIPDSN